MQKEIARRLMKTNLVQSSLQKEFIRTRVENWITSSYRRGLKPEGRPYFDDFVDRLQRGEKIALSSEIDMFRGFDYRSDIQGLNRLRNLKNKPILLVANHPNNGPLGGDWKNIVISYYIQQELNQELRDLHGFDPTTVRDIFRMKGYNSTNSIPVRDSNPQRSALLLRQAIKNRDSMRLYPEGDGGINLRRGLPTAGRLIALYARNNIDIITASTRFKNDTFSITFDNLNNERIKETARQSFDSNFTNQLIGDYALAKIAPNLPPNRRGYYQNYQEIISRFES